MSKFSEEDVPNIVRNGFFYGDLFPKDMAQWPSVLAKEQKPVAYRWRYEGEKSWTLAKNKPAIANNPDVICEPLYTATGKAKS